MAATFQMFTSAETWERATARLAYFGNDVCVREVSRVTLSPEDRERVRDSGARWVVGVETGLEPSASLPAESPAMTWAGCYACGHVEERELCREGLEWAACAKCAAPADKHMDSFDSREAATAGVDLPW